MVNAGCPPPSPGYPYSDLLDLSLVPTTPPRCHSRVTERWHEGVHKTLLQYIRQLRDNHRSGARELATDAVECFALVCNMINAGLAQEKDKDEDYKYRVWWTAVRRTSWIISTYARPSMSAAINVAVLKALEALGEGDEDRARERDRSDPGMGAYLQQFIRHKFPPSSPESTPRTVTILTLSLSSTIRHALLALLQLENSHGTGDNSNPLMVRLRIMESRPLCEGANLAKILADQAMSKAFNNLEIEIASDASVAILAREADIILLGADRISACGDVSNKTGSFPEVVCAKHIANSAVAIVISETEKVDKPYHGAGPTEEDNSPAELMRAWSADVQQSASLEMWKRIVRVRNVYFEWVPASYIDFYICETGILSVDDIQKQSQWVVRAEQRIFGDR
ncbi:hypothetical protein LOZ39_001465 [Ophidiomyces ophidiicola]|nr:hypothetical protein LOZ62_001406 [Ophidiomyces ophidiicola]KAI2041603.1 hypothetical protein LOZ47_000427 [Ophidiomyces ophidiicola]KAI2073434.1 hypothetical protein LOZ40_000920 [Ophidiomyces ophidiicola]KAI2078796.1 hypothetical protein LOZ39_001465 [Ophidiomyces ophidiicola]KAI2081770.1 hypothetical protein LOZ37_001117 [Ophidiomyces ophidiicola]